MPITIRVLLLALVLGAAGLMAAERFAGPPRHAVVIGYQTGVDPSKVAQAEGLYERAIGKPVVWRKFDSGTDVITALAAGDIDFGDLGSSPLAIAATRQLPITSIVLISRLGSTEALIARRGAGIDKPSDLIGKRVATPFISTSHYSLLGALHHWRIDPATVEILNLSPPQIAAAWARHDIDAAYIWDPALGQLKADGQVMAGSDEVARWGAPTYDVWVTRKDFAKSDPASVLAFVRVTLESQQRWRAKGAHWTKASPEVREIAEITGSRVGDVPGLLANNEYPDARTQASATYLGGGLRSGLANDLGNTARFLRAQGKVDRVLPSYAPYVDGGYVRPTALASGN